MTKKSKVHFGFIEGQFDSLRIACGGSATRYVTKMDTVSFADIDPNKRCKKCWKEIEKL